MSYEGQLTKHAPGSMREIWTLALPLMFSLISGNLMIFVDRVILARYSLDAMNAAGAAQMTFFILLMGALGIASIAEVFVGQHNGAREYKKTGPAAWQMIWFSLFSAGVFLPIALIFAPYLVVDYHVHEHGLPYFKWLNLFGPSFPLQAALSAFFIGIGRVKMVTVAALLGNLVNIFLDIALVFGISDILEPMGAKGAAIATGLAQTTQALVLGAVFLSPKYARSHGTHNFTFTPAYFWKSFKVGAPSACGHMIEVSAWALITNLLAKKGEDYVTVMLIGQSFFGLIAFTLEGIQKAVATIAANFIGAGKWELLEKAWISAVKLTLMMAVVVAPFLLSFPEFLIGQFLGDEISPERMMRMEGYLKIVSLSILAYFMFDGITWISAGILTAAGKTLFVMIANGINSWFFALTPMYLAVFYFDLGPTAAWIVLNFYGLINSSVFYLRYRLLKRSPEKSLISA